MKQRIVVCVRTLNEENRIGQFCSAYEQADTVLVADGGSTDNTVLLAETFPNVKIIYYDKRIELANGYWRNNDSDHANFLFEEARKLNPEWIIYDDCDCRPNYLLKRDYHKILAETDCDVVMAVRLYLWGKDKHFPRMASPLGEVLGQPSLYAWKGHLDFWTVDVPPAYTFRVGDKDITDFRIDMKALDLFFPYCLLHYSWDDPVRVEQKVKYYRESGFIKNMIHPLNFAGHLEDLPEFAHE